jgi:hypothetical protein
MVVFRPAHALGLRLKLSLNIRQRSSIPVSKTTATALLLLFAQLSYAECEGLSKKLNEKLGYLNRETEAYFSACKVWPADTSKTIVALAHFQKGSSFTVPPNESDGLYDLDVLIVKTDSGEIQNRLFQKGAVSSDSIYFSGIDIDTARYQLAPGVIAFGLRANRGGPAEVQTIRLYVIQNKLKQILSNLSMVEHFAENHTDCPHSSDVRRTLAVANTASHGYADLILQEKSIEGEPVRTNTECMVNETKSSQRYNLRFDGNTYVVPKELQSGY